MKHVGLPDAGNVIYNDRVIELEKVYIVGVTTGKSQWIHNFFLNVCNHCGFAPNPSVFFLGNLLKLIVTHGETWEYLRSPKNILGYFFFEPLCI